MFCMRTKKGTCITKNFKEKTIWSKLIQFFERRNTWNIRKRNCINQNYSSKNTFTQKLTRNKTYDKRDPIVSIVCLYFLLKYHFTP